MAGTAGRSGGRNKVSAEVHAIRGTFRKARHASAPQGPVGPAQRPGASTDWRPTAAELDALGPQARLLLDATLRLYRLDEQEGHVALQALRSLTLAERAEAEVAASLTVERVTIDGSGQEHREPKQHPLLPVITRERRLFSSLWGTLRLGR